MPHCITLWKKKKKRKRELDSAISEMVYEMSIYWGSSLHVWSGAPSRFKQCYPSFPLMQMFSSHVARNAFSEHAIIIWQVCSPRAWEPNVLVTISREQTALWDLCSTIKNERALETHPTRNFLNCPCWRPQGVLSQNGTFLTTQNVRSEASEC